MSYTDALQDVAQRINEIQARFAPPAPVPSTSSGTPFSQVLAAASLDPTASDPSLSAASLGLDGSGTGDGSDGGEAVSSAMKYLGVPYVWGGTDPNAGLDCSGLVQRAYKDIGVDLPRVAADQARMGTPVAGLADARPGDLVAFGSPVDHIGIYAGNGKMVVAPHRNDVVKVQDITATPTAIRRIVGARSDRATSLAGLIGIVGGTTTGNALGAGSSFARTLGMGNSAIGSVTTTTTTSGTQSAFDPLFSAAGAKYGISPQLLSAVARAESGFNPSAVSQAGAQGLMQLMPATAKSLGVDPLDPAQAVDGAARLLAGNLSKFGSVDLAVAAYNAGGGAVSRYGGVPPFAETQNYVRKVLAYAGASS